MQHKYINKAIAALSVTAAILLISCLPGQTQARYTNYCQWRGIYTPEKQTLSSDRLTAGGQTVLLNDWVMASGISRMEGISLFASTGSFSGVLRCVSDCPEYLIAELDRTEVTVSDAGVQVQLTLTPTEAALNLTEQTTAVVRVELLPEGSEAPSLWADYRVALTAPEPETASEGLPPEPETLVLDSAESFAWSELLAVSVTAPAEADTLRLTYAEGNFPEGTRYIQNGEAFLLGDEMAISFGIGKDESQTLFLDFSQLTEPHSGEITLQAQTVSGQTITAAGTVTVATDREALGMDLTQFNPVLTGKKELLVPITGDTAGLTWRLEMLTETGEGVVYTQSDEQFYLVVTISEDPEDGSRNVITISNAGGKAPAGTYRLALERLQDEEVISSRYLQFFICY